MQRQRSGRSRIFLPELLYHDGRFLPGWGVEVAEAGGRIVRVAPEAELLGRGGQGGAGEPAADDVVVERLSGRALMPGFINGHSHAFQRVIRGRTQWRPASAPHADFWSWREAMYAAALALSPEEVYDVSRACFLEMLRAGYTTVGEFHYLQRDPDGARYADPNELAHRVIAAAESVGIRIVLLNVCYATGGIERPLLPEQRRFNTPDPELYLADTDLLRQAWAGHAGVTVGVAPHSVRAVPRAWLPELHSWARAHDLPFHIHASEQPAEVEAAVAAWGLRPVELLAEEGVLDERLTAVHATHLTPAEVALLGAAGATVCACPTTERDLGDGFLQSFELLAAGAQIALGTDSQTVIDPLEEMRLVEYHERLRRLQRVILTVPGGADRLENAPPLLEMGTSAGARALRLEAGRIETGHLADLVAVDLEHPTLAGCTAEYLAATLALSAPAAVISDVWVGGVRLVEGGRHPLDDEAPARLRRVAAGL